MYRFLPRHLLSVALLVGIQIGPLSAEGDRPNLVLIIADDMAWDDCGA